MSKNRELHVARVNKKDEFYTQLIDIEKEMMYYMDYFKDKIIYCNCDNPDKSSFWEYFHLHFKELQLKKIIATYYNNGGSSFKMEYTGGNDFDITSGIKTPLIGDGNFQSEECLKILKDSDMVCTNPPFSLFRPFISTLIEYQKQFIILGNLNAITCKDIFPLIKEDKLWFGPSIHSGDREFQVPDDYPLESAGFRIDENSKKYIRVKGVRWFSNLDTNKRHEKLELQKSYTPENYQKYDNYNIINVNKTSDIPNDYYDVMGVPITFFDKYNPEQFEILGIANSARWIGYKCLTIINGKKKYNRLLIRRRIKS